MEGCSWIPGVEGQPHELLGEPSPTSLVNSRWGQGFKLIQAQGTGHTASTHSDLWIVGKILSSGSGTPSCLVLSLTSPFPFLLRKGSHVLIHNNSYLSLWAQWYDRLSSGFISCNPSTAL